VSSEVREADKPVPGGAAASRSLLIDRARDLLKLREDAARGVDAQAAAVAAATLAVIAFAASGDALDAADDSWLVVAGFVLLLSALAGGISRLPAPPPLKAVLSRRERKRVLALYNPEPARPSLRRLGRDLGKQIRLSEERIRSMTPDTPVEALTEELLTHWRSRSDLARYRMHSKSAWFTLSISLLYIAVIVVTVSVV